LEQFGFGGFRKTQAVLLRGYWDFLCDFVQDEHGVAADSKYF
jgi:hypothetical protein